jgi:radical SAM superfamily enzyme YgiQ (UPF0313 family)
VENNSSTTPIKLLSSKERSLSTSEMSNKVNFNLETARLIVDSLQSRLPHGCKKVLFVTPPESPKSHFTLEIALSKRYPCFPPYGPALLARNLRLRNYETEILDLNFEVLRHAHTNPTELNFDIWISKLDEFITLYNPDIIALSVMFTITSESAQEVVQYLSNNYPNIPIIIGGVAVSNDVKLFLEKLPQVACAGVYEADQSLVDLLDVVNNRLPIEKVKQFAIRDQGVIKVIEDRSTPTEEEIDLAPDYHRLPVGEYSQYGSIGAYNFRTKGRKAGTIYSNRGCRARCSFCSVRNFNGLDVRSRSIKSVVDEIQYMKEQHGVSHFMWLDDDLLKDPTRVIALFEEISNRDLDITWDASNGLIAASITPAIMDAAVRSGCIGFNLGLESGNDRILREIRKPGTTKSYLRAKEILSNYPDVFVKGFTIIGFPNETIAEINETVRFFLELNFDWYPIQLLTPLPGTPISLSMIEQGLISSAQQGDFKGSAAGSKSGSGGTLRKRENSEKLNAKQFDDLLNKIDGEEIPTKEQLDDIWFVVDYKLNYKKILAIDDPIKLKKIEAMLEQITDMYTNENAMGNQFLGVIAAKLGNDDKAKLRFAKAREYQRDSAYWTARFEALAIYEDCQLALLKASQSK